MPDEIVFRHAAVEDAAEIAHLQVRVWQSAYRGLIPDGYLDALHSSLPMREAFRRESLSRTPRRIETWVAELGGSVIGFVDFGPSRDDEGSTGAGEILAIYVDGAHPRRGLGRTLVAHALDELRSMGFAEATLWVLDSNVRARAFYESLGWQPDGASKMEPRAGFSLSEVRYRRTMTP